MKLQRKPAKHNDDDDDDLQVLWDMKPKERPPVVPTDPYAHIRLAHPNTTIVVNPPKMEELGEAGAP